MVYEIAQIKHQPLRNETRYRGPEKSFSTAKGSLHVGLHPPPKLAEL